MIKLKDAERGLSNFLPRAERLRGKLGPIQRADAEGAGVEAAHARGVIE